MRVSNGRTALYRHRDKNGTLLYVGISLSVAARLAQHEATSHWFAEVTQVDVEYFPTRDEACAAERVAIQTEHPRCNKAHTEYRAPRAKRERVERVPFFEPVVEIVAPKHSAYVSNSFDSVREARTYLYRSVAELQRLADKHRATYDAVRARHPEDTELRDLGHRFWLRLTDSEFDACRWSVLAAELRFLLDHCEFMEEDDEWLMAADDLWSMFCLLTFKWASRRDELEFRWPQLAAAA